MEQAPNVEDLFRRAQAGEQAALEQLCAHALAWLSRWGHRRLPQWARDRFTTDDLAQMTVWRFLERLQAFEPRTEDALRKFLAVVFKNALRDEIRRAKRRPERDDEKALLDRRALLNERKEPPQWEELLAKAAVERVRRAFKKLKTADQQILSLRLDGASYAEVAAQLERPNADAARVAVRRALERLRTLVDGPS